jgi:hypothetical protein
MRSGLTVLFCGERYGVQPGESFVVGRDGGLAIPDNPYLHRRFLEISDHDAMWWLANVGSRLSATVSDDHGTIRAQLAPGAHLPIMAARTFVWFTAGSTVYDFEILVDRPQPVGTSLDEPEPEPESDGQLTIGIPIFTSDQRRLILALAEPMLRHGLRGSGAVPTSAEASRRLGWPITKFNRKLDNVCEKLARTGVRGLHGEQGRLAINRRSRLVEYAISTRLVQPSDLGLLDAPE